MALAIGPVLLALAPFMLAHGTIVTNEVLGYPGVPAMGWFPLTYMALGLASR